MENKKSKSKFRNSIFDLKWKNKFQKISFIFQIWLMHWKRKHETQIFLNLFWFKTYSKSKNQNFWIHFSISNQKMNFIKFFHFSIFFMKLKNEKWKFFKIRFGFEIKKLIILLVHELVHGFEIVLLILRITNIEILIWRLFFVFHVNLENEKPNLLKYLIQLIIITPYTVTRNQWPKIKFS